MSFRLLQCLGVENPCYKHYKGINLVPEGIVVHTTDANNKTIKRYVEPAPGQKSGMSDNGEPVSASKMATVLGDNVNNNSWNCSGATSAVHAFIGTVANGSLVVCQFLPWQSPCWGSGSGPNGTVNGCHNGKAKAPLYVQFEICEGPYSDLDYCRKTYQTAVEFCAYLIKMFPTIKPEKIFGHKEIYEQGKSGVRADPIKYWNACKSGYTMDGFRADVREELKKKPESEAINMTEEQLEQFVNGIIDQRFPGLWDQAYQRKMDSYRDNDSGAWSKKAREWAVDNGIVVGVGTDKDGNPNYAWAAPLTREQYVQTEYRQHLNNINEEGSG